MSTKELSAREPPPLPQSIFIWTLFVSVILAHFFLARHWFEKDFVTIFHSSNAFLTTISEACKAIVNKKYFFLDPSVIKSTDHVGVGTYWPVATHMIGLGPFLPLKLFFLPNVFIF